MSFDEDDNSRSIKKVWRTRTTGKRKRGCPRKTWENSMADISKARNVTLNEASKKVQNKKERVRFVRE